MKRLLSFALAVILIMSLSITALAAEYTGTVDPINVLLINADNGDVLYSKNEDDIAYCADLVKLMTAYVTVKCIDDLDSVVSVSPYALYDVYEGYNTISPALTEYEEITVRDLLAGMLLGCGNDCAQALAVYIGGSVGGFVDYMNDYAYKLGMTDTVFTNPTGNHYGGQFTTAADLATLACELVKYPELMDIFSAETYTIPATNTSAERTVYNTNKLICADGDDDFRYEYATGMIAGHNNYAASCLAASAEKYGVNLVCIILGDISRSHSDRWTLSADLFEYGFEQYPPVPAANVLSNIPVIYTDENGEITEINVDFTDVTVKHDTLSEGITATVVSEDGITGTVIYTDLAGKVVAEIPVTIKEEPETPVEPETPDEQDTPVVEDPTYEEPVVIPEDTPEEEPEEEEEKSPAKGSILSAVLSAIVLAAAIFVANLVVEKKRTGRHSSERDSFKVKFRQNFMTYVLFFVIAIILIIIICSVLM